MPPLQPVIRHRADGRQHRPAVGQLPCQSLYRERHAVTVEPFDQLLHPLHGHRDDLLPAVRRFVGPVEKRSRERLYRSEYSFEAHDLPKVQSAIECGNFAVLQNLPRSYQPAAQVICYRTDSGSLIAAQVLMNRQPTGEIKVFRAGEYDF